jgi:hypothetical protein
MVVRPLHGAASHKASPDKWLAVTVEGHVPQMELPHPSGLSTTEISPSGGSYSSRSPRGPPNQIPKGIPSGAHPLGPHKGVHPSVAPDTSGELKQRKLTRTDPTFPNQPNLNELNLI